MKKSKYEIAEELFFNTQYIEAFNAFKDLTKSSYVSSNEKSDAYNMMGAIIHFDTRIGDITDESGLNFFVKSLEYNPYNLGALLNIIENFGTSINAHSNVEIFDVAVNRLKEVNYQYTQEFKTLLEEKHKIKETLIDIVNAE